MWVLDRWNSWIPVSKHWVILSDNQLVHWVFLLQLQPTELWSDYQSHWFALITYQHSIHFWRFSASYIFFWRMLLKAATSVEDIYTGLISWHVRSTVNTMHVFFHFILQLAFQPPGIFMASFLFNLGKGKLTVFEIRSRPKGTRAVGLSVWVLNSVPSWLLHGGGIVLTHFWVACQHFYLQNWSVGPAGALQVKDFYFWGLVSFVFSWKLLLFIQM